MLFPTPHNGTCRLSQRAEDETGIILEHLHVKATQRGSAVQLGDLGEYEGPPPPFPGLSPPPLDGTVACVILSLPTPNSTF